MKIKVRKNSLAWHLVNVGKAVGFLTACAVIYTLLVSILIIA